MLLLMLMLMNSPASPAEQLWETIRGEPNVVLFMRHAAVEAGDALRRDDGDGCVGETRLSEAGKNEARYIGVRLAARGVEPVVVSSPTCRCRETAALAFGERMTTDPMLRELPAADAPQAGDFDRAAGALIAAHRGSAPLVIVSHATNIARLTHETVSTTEAVVGRAKTDGGFEVLGKVSLTD